MFPFEIKSFKAPGFLLKRLKLNFLLCKRKHLNSKATQRHKKRSTYLFKDKLNVKDSCLVAYKDGYLKLNTIFIILLLYLLTVSGWIGMEKRTGWFHPGIEGERLVDGTQIQLTFMASGDFHSALWFTLSDSLKLHLDFCNLFFDRKKSKKRKICWKMSLQTRTHIPWDLNKKRESRTPFVPRVHIFQSFMCKALYPDFIFSR